ncbi:MAG: hypothetical protein NTZ08_12385 [Verrucomicrobia bacterium]|nr:hypothetical protein [Verrucomicrobiota bacterium]
MEIVTLYKPLPAAKRAEVTDFARFLLERSAGSYGLNANELHAASRHLHPKAQTARRKGLSREFTGDIEELVRI